MATETVTRLVDDLDGGAADRTIAFSWEGRSYEIDLSKKNISSFEKVIKPYVAVARPSGADRRPARRNASAAARAAKKAKLQAIRDWARANGHDVSDRGRIPASISEAFKAAQ
ncbi:histone-like nucleoid-structuring protein Lsr2 [Jatrophihabitans sp. DSM 45814]